jgi:uncharacterized membrane protein YeaQ/YmgE (transglycosylase-associated protein family)
MLSRLGEARPTCSSAGTVRVATRVPHANVQQTSRAQLTKRRPNGTLERPLAYLFFEAADPLAPAQIHVERRVVVHTSGPAACRFGFKEASMGLLYWIIVGLIAGWLAGQVMKGGGYGVLVDIILGILGGIVGGWLFGVLGIWPGGGVIGSIIVAFVGAVVLIWISRILKRA